MEHDNNLTDGCLMRRQPRSNGPSEPEGGVAVHLSFNLKIFAVAVVVAGAVGWVMPSAQATTYNLTTDWSDTTNPNGVWTYQRAGVAFASTVSDWSGGGKAWADLGTSGPGFTPMLLKYDGVLSESIDALAGDIVGHTNTSDSNAGAGNLSILFKMPTAGTASISGKVWDAHTTVDRDQVWQVLVNGSPLASETVVGDGTNGRSAPDLFALAAIALAAGDTVELRLFRSGSDNGGLLGMDMTVDVTPSAVPLPAALPLFATILGAAGIAGWRRRRLAAA
jgi:hypothetical protein